jgi:hypothetical protein
MKIPPTKAFPHFANLSVSFPVFFRYNEEKRKGDAYVPHIVRPLPQQIRLQGL